MLQFFLMTHRIRRATHRIGKIASSCAILFGLSVLSLAHASVFCPGGTCGGINAGVGVAATAIPGVTTNTPAVTINNIITVAVSYVNILAVAVIVIAGFYLILGLGNDSSKDTAKKIILYTAIGIAIISLAQTIVNFFMGIPSGTTSGAISTAIQNILNVVTSYVGILAVAVIVIAGFYLILGLGNDSSKETARKIVLYTAIGIVLIGLVNVIVGFFIGIPLGVASIGITAAIQDILDVITSYVGILAVAVIVIAGFYLILGLGNDSSKETARKIILYAAIGIVVILLANVIVAFFQGLPTGADTSGIYSSIRTILITVLGFTGLLAVVVIVIAGIMLLISGGDEGRKDTAKKMIMYAIIGLIVIALASVIVRFVDSLL